MHPCLIFIVISVPAGFGWRSARGDVVEYENAAQWQAAVGEYTTIDFVGFPSGTIITEQYASLGVHLTDGNDTILGFGLDGFPNDGWGLKGHIIQPSGIHIAFDAPQRWLAVEFPGLVDIQLFRNGEMFHESVNLGVGGLGNFAGLVSTIGFDEAYLSDSDGFVFIDDLHFGVPGPGALPLLALAGAIGMKRRRRR
jgi:hypothetical protein